MSDWDVKARNIVLWDSNSNQYLRCHGAKLLWDDEFASPVLRALSRYGVKLYSDVLTGDISSYIVFPCDVYLNSNSGDKYVEIFFNHGCSFEKYYDMDKLS